MHFVYRVKNGHQLLSIGFHHLSLQRSNSSDCIHLDNYGPFILNNLSIESIVDEDSNDSSLKDSQKLSLFLHLNLIHFIGLLD